MEPRPPTARVIRLEDVDAGVKSWFEKYVGSDVELSSGERRQVAVVFGAGERWVAASDKGGIRDRDGRIILPVIAVRRTGIDPVNNMSALGANVPKMVVARKVADKTAQLANNDLSRPISQRRLRGRAVYDIITIPFPFVGTLTYEVVIHTQYIAHMNSIVEKIASSLEFYDVPSFVIDVELGQDPKPVIHDGKGARELTAPEHAEFAERIPLNSYYFVGYFEGDFGDSGNLQEFTDEERIIEMRIGFRVPVCLQLDPPGNRPAVQHKQTAFGISIGEERCVAVDDPSELDEIFGPK